MSTKITYKDYAVGAAEDAAFTAAGQEDFSDLDLAFAPDDTRPYITLEPRRWRLDGSFVSRNVTVPFWSEALSMADGTFSTEPSITVAFDEQYSSVGISLIFDSSTGDYCDRVNIKWYQGDTLKADQDFAPNAVQYFCYHRVTSYDKVVITLRRTAKPYRRARVDAIYFGILREYGMSEIRSARITNETDLISSTVPVCMMDWVLDSTDDIEYMFQFKQEIIVSQNGTTIGVFYVDNSNRTASNLYSLKCKDAFGILDDSTVYGAYPEGVSAKALFSAIVGGLFDVVYEVEDTTLYGVIASTTRRNALQQVLFAWGVNATTDGSNQIRVFSFPTEPVEIGRDRTYTGASVANTAMVTKVTVIAHTYTSADNGSVKIGDAKYDDTQTVYTVENPNVTANDKVNEIEVKEATLVSPHNAQLIAQRVYDYHSKTEKASAKIVWRGEMLGDCVTVPKPWPNEVATGNITKIVLNLSNTIAAETEVR